jgi:hypothetical protein
MDGIDWERVAEELHDLGISQERELKSRLSQLMYHMLKIERQPERPGRSWEASVKARRRGIAILLKKQPSLRPLLDDPEFMKDAYHGGTSTLAAQENLPDDVFNRFPEVCPYSIEQLLPEC